jgi:hypothetical protein
MKIFGLHFITLLIALLLGFPGAAQEKGREHKLFIDTLDNAFDISYYLYNLHGFIPIVSPITEPAVGYGAAGAGVFFVPKKPTGNNKKFNMPDVVAFGGGYTQNRTWFAGLGYFGFWKKDHIRYRGAGGYGDVKLKYFGRGDGFLNEHPANFTIRAYGLVQQAVFRIGESRFMLGGKYIFSKTKVIAFDDSKLPWVDPREFNLTNSGAGVIGEFENFDNIFSPVKGFRINVTYNQYLELLGSDRDFGRLSTFVICYFPVLSQRWVSGFRTEFQMATGDPPFYAYPFLILRGIPAMRYQGKYTLLGETEQLVMLTRRWGIVGFAGLGGTFNNNLDGLNLDGVKAWNAGAGFRYLLARVFGLKMGIDVARGPEDWAFYIVFGSGWLR